MTLAMHRHRRRICLLLVTASTMLLGTSCTRNVRTPSAGPEPSAREVVSQLKPDQRVRIQNHNYQMFRGRMVLAGDDSVYVAVSEKNLIAPGDTIGIAYSEVDRIYRIDRKGVLNGLLWAGGTFLAALAVTAGIGDSLGSMLMWTAATVVAVPTAIVMGTMRTRETLIYSRHSRF